MKKKYIGIVAGSIVLVVGLSVWFFPSPGDEQVEKTVAETTDNKRNYETKEEIPPHKDNEKDLDPEVMRQTKDLAEQFVSLMAPIDPTQEKPSLEALKSIVTERVYESISESPARPTLTIAKRELLDLETFPVDDILEDRKKWNVIAFVETSNSSGNTEQEQLWYWVSVAKRAGEWKITGYELGEDFR